MKEIKLLIDGNIDVLDMITTKYLKCGEEKRCLRQYRKYELEEMEVIDMRSVE